VIISIGESKRKKGIQQQHIVNVGLLRMFLSGRNSKCKNMLRERKLIDILDSNVGDEIRYQAGSVTSLVKSIGG